MFRYIVIVLLTFGCGVLTLIMETWYPLDLWLLVVLAAVCFGGAAIGIWWEYRTQKKANPKKRTESKSKLQVPTETVLGVKAKNKTILLDGRLFSRCEFESCTFRWNGGPWGFQECRVVSPRIETQDPLVCRTVDTLKSFGFLEDEFSRSWHWVPDEHLD